VPQNDGKGAPARWHKRIVDDASNFLSRRSVPSAASNSSSAHLRSFLFWLRLPAGSLAFKSFPLLG